MFSFFGKKEKKIGELELLSELKELKSRENEILRLKEKLEEDLKEKLASATVAEKFASAGAHLQVLSSMRVYACVR